MKSPLPCTNMGFYSTTVQCGRRFRRATMGVFRWLTCARGSTCKWYKKHSSTTLSAASPFAKRPFDNKQQWVRLSLSIDTWATSIWFVLRKMNLAFFVPWINWSTNCMIRILITWKRLTGVYAGPWLVLFLSLYPYFSCFSFYWLWYIFYPHDLRRYTSLWLPLIVERSNNGAVDAIVGPLDVEWLSHTHRLVRNPVPVSNDLITF